MEFSSSADGQAQSIAASPQRNKVIRGTLTVVVHVLSGGAATLIFADGFEFGDTSAWWLAGR